jgi:NADPH-dependent glutamate synthase beta subunit-like oxidoreductase/formate hydrogenlyase subunit 6/NADH:ubiquinone oxidoreductase subunit I
MEINKSAAVIGDNLDALQAALCLARAGIEVKFITSRAAFAPDKKDGQYTRLYWSTVLNCLNHPGIDFIYDAARVTSAGQGPPLLEVHKKQNYVDPGLCTGCKKCEENCSTRISSLQDGVQVTRKAVHKPFPGYKSVPSVAQIEKDGIAPCRAACPLGINVQGFTALLANGKTEEAFRLIDNVAPLGGILGRLCQHPCESKCSRAEADSPLAIRALHRYAYDNTNVTQSHIAPTAPHRGKVAIIGSGPAGLMAARELKLRSYEPTIFESHNTLGGMLATGIPRFRLPRETRERDINRLLDSGIEVRTGITVGRDTSFANLREQGYGAFFLAIGASRNNRLNIPGERLDGVIDCMPFLLTLTQKDDLFIGSNIIIIGDGNTAVDSARVALRANRGSVKIVSWTTPGELTANLDELEEALQEGALVEYSAVPVEILGDAGRVTGVRFRRTRLTDDIMRNGRHRPKPVHGTDFVLLADHVIIAIGQSADANQLALDGLAVDSSRGTVKVNPATLQTSIEGVFAGGDCVRGPNNVVEAMADGRRAAASIDLYLSGKPLQAQPCDERPIARIDLNTISASSNTRAEMLFLDMEKRKATYEETTLGLTAGQALLEAGRCLNCALCSECMECVSVCKAGAIDHSAGSTPLTIHAGFAWKFPTDGLEVEAREGVFDFSGTPFSGIDGRPSFAGMAAVLKAVMDHVDAAQHLIASEGKQSPASDEFNEFAAPHVAPRNNQCDSKTHPKGHKTGVILCRCNGANSDAIDFETLSSQLRGMAAVEQVDQACSRTGADHILSKASENGLHNVVLAACRCCAHDEPCYSCNDRRILCRQHLANTGGLHLDFSYVNVREMCAWAFAGDRQAATMTAVNMLQASLIASGLRIPQPTISYPIRQSVLFIGDSAPAREAGLALEALGVPTSRLPGPTNVDSSDAISIEGRPGDYRVSLLHSGNREEFRVGAIALDTATGKPAFDHLHAGYPGRLLARMLENPERADKYTGTLQGNGLFIGSWREGITLAGSLLLYLHSRRIDVAGSKASTDALLCRGCGKCAAQCALIEMCPSVPGQQKSYVEPALCTACGGCSSACPSGAIGPGGRAAIYPQQALKAILCNTK